MEEKFLFQDTLKKIETYALKRDKILTIEEIDDFLRDMNLSREQLELVYEYLITKRITIKGYESVKTGKETDEKENIEPEEDTKEDQNVLNFYFEEMEATSLQEPESEKEMFLKTIQGDGNAKADLINHNLKLVVQIAKRYQDNGVELSDLIQEGNVALMLAMDNLNEVSFEEGHELEAFHEYLADEITSAVLNTIAIEENLNSDNEEILNKINHIHEAVKTLTEEMGRSVSIEEVAKYLDMEPEGIEEVIHLSTTELSIKHDHHHNSNQKK